MGDTREIEYVEFAYHGVIVSDMSSKEVKSRDIKALEIPEGAYAFRFYTILETDVKRGNKLVTTSSSRLDVSPWYYPGGEVLCLGDVQARYPDQNILMQNMRGNSIKQVVRTRHGGFMPMYPGDKVCVGVK